MNVERKGS